MSNKNMVRGKDVFLLSDSGVIICAKTCTLSKTWEVIETTHFTSTSKEFVTGMSEADVTVEGIITVEAINPTDKTVWDFFDGGVKSFEMTFDDPAGNSKSITFNAIVPTVSLTGDVSAFAGFSLNLKVTGDLTIT